MSFIMHNDIRIGTLAGFGKDTAHYLQQIADYGFESFELTLNAFQPDVNIQDIAKSVLDVIGDKAVISCLGLYGNPLQDEKCAKDWHTLVKSAKLFNADLVTGFTGAVENLPVDQNMSKFKEVFTPIVRLAEDEGVRIAFENCDMGGVWNKPRFNIAHSPTAWEMMFNEIPSDNLGLEWEPCHQMVSLIDPIPQLRKWVRKVFHLHGKDATVMWDVLREKGLRSGVPFVYHRTPGFGDTNWTDIITILRLNGYKGSIDIEGWHDPVYRGDLEMTGQVHALKYLKKCRGGDFVQNPV